MLELMSHKGQTLQELVAPLREKYFISGEINTKMPDHRVVQEKLDALAARYSDAKRLYDGRRLGRVSGLALQRARIEHRAADSVEPGSDDAGEDGTEARRGAGVHPELSVATDVIRGRAAQSFSSSDWSLPRKKSLLARSNDMAGVLLANDQAPSQFVMIS